MVGEMGGWGAVAELGWRKGPWTPEEDKLLVEYVRSHGEGRWNSVARITGLKRNGKSCRLRWVNYLRPDLKRGQITPNEEKIIIDLHARWGNRWSTIARSLPGRTDNEIKNYWRTHFKTKPAKAPRPGVESARTRLLKRQQFRQHQQLQQQKHDPRQQPQPVSADIRAVLSFLDDDDHQLRAPPYVPHVSRPEFFAGYPEDPEGVFCSVLGDANCNGLSLQEDFGEEILWDGLLWNADEFHATSRPAAALQKRGSRLPPLPFC
ncbi:hypothetical protein MLD38_039523 [Melastoma candidum]|uniref:Uncharacterized protein n=1 Tax=Melastoma candidum TaxID=119954 RepID=A0ACB9L3F7_9MYRT|nr:hypothetical protein MLD38_039523 [Melastoma candidum]